MAADEQSGLTDWAKLRYGTCNLNPTPKQVLLTSARCEILQPTRPKPWSTNRALLPNQTFGNPERPAQTGCRGPNLRLRPVCQSSDSGCFPTRSSCCLTTSSVRTGTELAEVEGKYEIGLACSKFRGKSRASKLCPLSTSNIEANNKH